MATSHGRSSGTGNLPRTVRRDAVPATLSHGRVTARARTACLLLSGVLVTAAACGRPPALPPSIHHPQRENVVLIVMDTTRADHVHCYGYGRETTPFIDAFARHATRYSRALADAPWTLPAHASMFTGKAPHAHGAHGFDAPLHQNNVAPLPKDVPVIAEAFRHLGYRTAAFAANSFFLSRRWGLYRGFDTYAVNNEYGGPHDRRIDHWLATQAHEPFFLFVNYIDAHLPYNVAPHPGVVGHPVPGNGTQVARLKQEVMSTNKPIPKGLSRLVHDQYDLAVANLDEAVGRLLLDLDRRGMLHNTVVIVTADHGEYLGEHRLVEHNEDVYQPAITVPLLIRTPDAVARVDPTIVTSEDMPWLIATHVRDPQVRAALEHFSRGPGTHPVMSENYYTLAVDLATPWGKRFHRIRRALFEWPYKLIASSDGHDELYDLSRDPGEHHNLVNARPAMARRMIQEVEAATSGNATRVGSRNTHLSAHDLQQMRALGYAN